MKINDLYNWRHKRDVSFLLSTSLKGDDMIELIFTAVLSFALYCSYEIGRCSAIHDLSDGKVCEDLEFWKERYKRNE